MHFNLLHYSASILLHVFTIITRYAIVFYVWGASLATTNQNALTVYFSRKQFLHPFGFAEHNFAILMLPTKLFCRATCAKPKGCNCLLLSKQLLFFAVHVCLFIFYHTNNVYIFQSHAFICIVFIIQFLYMWQSYYDHDYGKTDIKLFMRYHIYFIIQW